MSAQPLLSVIPFLRPLLSLVTGETIPLDATIAATSLLLAPVCIPIGMQFPLAVRMLAGDAPRAFLLEALGALLGGAAFTFLIAGHAGAPAVLAAVSVISVLLGAALLRRAAVTLLALVPLLVSLGLSTAKTVLPDEDVVLLSRTDSRYGTVEVFQTRGQMNVFAGGKFQRLSPSLSTAKRFPTWRKFARPQCLRTRPEHSSSAWAGSTRLSPFSCPRYGWR